MPSRSSSSTATSLPYRVMVPPRSVVSALSRAVCSQPRSRDQGERSPRMPLTSPALGTIGVFTFAVEQLPAAQAAEAMAEIEALGYGAVWIPEARGKEAFTHAALLLGGADRIAVCTGVASIWGRDPMTAAAA